MKDNRINLILIFCFAFCFKLSFSQQFTSNSGKDEPIEIYADNGIEWHKNKKNT